MDSILVLPLAALLLKKQRLASFIFHQTSITISQHGGEVGGGGGYRIAIAAAEAAT